MQDNTNPVHIADIEAMVFRWPVATPVITSFGTMTDRPALLVRVRDDAGRQGWGEVWCNFPSPGAEHRARLIEEVLKPWLIGRSFTAPDILWRSLSAAFEVLALQSGEPGPFAQAIAGIDIALWDLAAQSAGEPLWRLLSPRAVRDTVPVYASGINPAQAEDTIARVRERGFNAFKVKVGFGLAQDIDTLQRATRALASGEHLCADANQAWTLEQALVMADAVRTFELAWLEEPLRVDRPAIEWQALARALRQPIAAGENLGSEAAFRQAVDEHRFAVVQPDVAKWGGLSGCIGVARRALSAGLRYCPHYLGAGVGLLASAHLLAASGSDGWLEVDSNDNPLREHWCPPLSSLHGGRLTLPAAPGLGAAPDIGAFADLRVAH
jgi:L-alanine-DL-glutamate epimerase-like enolase superfamily enzyme